MIESTETASAATVEPKDDIAESSIELDSDEIDERSGFRPSKTLLAALFILTTTIGIAGFAGFTLWSLSDHQASPEQPAASRPNDR